MIVRFLLIMNCKMSDTPQTQTSAEVQSVTVDDLSKKIQDTTKELDQLKNWLNIYTFEEQDRRLSEIEDSILDCTQDLQQLETEALSNSDKDELKKLKSKIDALKSSKDQLKQQIERETKTAIDALSQEVAQSQSQGGSEKSEEKKETWKKILRIVWWVWIVAWTVALFRRIFGKKDDGDSKESRKERRRKRREERKSKSFWERPLGKVLKWTWIWTGVYYVIHGIKTGRRNPKEMFNWKEKWEAALTVEESLSIAAWEVNCGKIDENMFLQNFNWIEYDKDSGLIKSYWEYTQIDEKKRCIVWLEQVKFKTNIELVHAANIINCLKYNLRWKWWAKDAFSETSTWWDIQFCFSEAWAREVISGSNTDLWRNILSVVWAGGWAALWYLTWNVAVWIWSAIWLGAAWYIWWNAIDDNSSLWKCCSTIKEWEHFKRFIWYLNWIQEWWESIWLPWKQHVESEDKSPIQVYINDVIKEIESASATDVDRWKARNLKAEQDPQNPNKYTISSYGQTTTITFNSDIKNNSKNQLDPSSIKSITIEKYWNNDICPELKLDFPHTQAWLKEAIKVVNLTNMIRKEYAWMWWEKYPIFYNTKNFYQWDWHTLLPNSLYKSGLRVDSNWDNWTSSTWTRILTNETLSSTYPTLHKDLKKSQANTQNYFEDQLNGKRWGSSYLKFINGMRTEAQQNYRVKGQNN